MKKYILIFGFTLVALVGILIYQLISFSDNKLHVVFCDIGQGDAIFIRTPGGADILVDGGPDSKVLDCLFNHMPFWDRDIEVMYATHPDADHITGLVDVFRNYNVKYFGTSNAPKDTQVFKQLNEMIAKEGLNRDLVYRGDKVVFSDKVNIKTFWPTVEFENSHSKETNDYSLVQEVSYGNFSILLDGDVPATILNSIMPTLDKVDVFKPPHHGSKTGVDEFTFQHLIPKLAVISVGKKNRYGHPHPKVLQVLKDNNIPYLKTDEKGDIEIVSDGKSWWVKN